MRGSNFLEICCTFFIALAGRWIAAETYAWMPAIADWLLRLYSQFLPGETGERLLEEWRSLLFETPGNLSKLLVAIDLGRTMLVTKREVEAIEEAEKDGTSSTTKKIKYHNLSFLLGSAGLLVSTFIPALAGAIVSVFAMIGATSIILFSRMAEGSVHGHRDVVRTPKKP